MNQVGVGGRGGEVSVLPNQRFPEWPFTVLGGGGACLQSGPWALPAS